MSKGGGASDQLTVLVFKDNFAARTFRLPLAWISRLGILLGFAACVIILTSFLTFKYYRAARYANPTRLRDLEQEILDLRSTLAARPAVTPAAAAPPADPSVMPLPSPATPPAVAALPVIPAPVPVTLTPAASGPLPFLLRPLVKGQASARPETLPIKLAPVQLTWRGKFLAVRSSIQYVSEGGGKQNGRIMIVAIGPRNLYAYPEGSLSTGPGESLLNASRGETFSVSRFREIAASIGPIDARGLIEEVQVLLLDETGKLLVSESARASTAKSAQGKETNGPAF